MLTLRIQHCINTLNQGTEHTKTGTRPFFLSSAMAFFKVSPLREKFSSTGRNFIFTREIKPAFSTEECALKNNKKQSSKR